MDCMNNLELLKIRARHANNDRQRDRMVLDKLKSFHRALLYSYQTAWIKKDGVEDAEYVRALINPDKVKFDYDEKIVSVDFLHNFKPGDTFEWQNTGTHWIILKQELTELAYFRGNVRRCQYLEAIDPETKETVGFWAAIRGPVETKLNTIQKAGIVADIPNLTLNIYLPKTEQTTRMFDRYFTFKFENRYWRVTAPDSISTPGILEIAALEDYECHYEDIALEQKPSEPSAEIYIKGNTIVKPLESSNYQIDNLIEGQEWQVVLPSNNKDIEDILEWQLGDDGKTITITWIDMISGSYIVRYGNLEKTVIVESLF